jgi:ribosome-associated protein
MLAGMARIRITRDISIPDAEVEMRASRSGGPGGQSVNTSDSKVELRWDVAGTSALSEAQRARVLERLGHRITDDGVLLLRSSEHKSQHRNREAAIARLRSLVAEAVEPPKRRRPTRRSKGANERRIRSKKQRGEIKRLRRNPPA